MNSADRFVLLGLAHPRSAWFRTLAQWANSASIPASLVKCVSADEVVARLESGRPYSALVTDAGLPAVDRDLLAQANASACAVLVVDDPRVTRQWTALGAAAVLARDFGRDELLSALSEHALRVSPAHATATEEAPDDHRDGQHGIVVAVTGSGGTGVSTTAVAVAQGLASDRRTTGTVLLADFCLRAEQAMLHDAGDVLPGIQELVEAHRAGRPAPGEVRSLMYVVEPRGYQLLLGLRQSRYWSTIRPRALEAAVDSLSDAYGAVVYDTDGDFEGEDAGGSIDVEERHGLARTVAQRADVVFVVGLASMKGLHSLCRVVDDLVAVGVPVSRILPVVNRSPRQARARAALTRALHDLLRATDGGGVFAGPLFLPERRVDDAFRDGVALPAALCQPLAGAVHALAAQRRTAPTLAPAPVRVRPGSLGAWTEQALG